MSSIEKEREFSWEERRVNKEEREKIFFYSIWYFFKEIILSWSSYSAPQVKRAKATLKKIWILLDIEEVVGV